MMITIMMVVMVEMVITKIGNADVHRNCKYVWDDGDDDDSGGGDGYIKHYT